MTADPARSEIRLRPMEVPKASDVLADELRERILSGEFAEGTPLPPERELVVQTGMSRTTVREALRILEVQDLIRIKAGRAGGAFVRRPGEESVANSLELLIRGRQIRLASVHETREAIEPSCARLAATHRTAEDLRRLESANERIAGSGGLEDFLQANVDWHMGVATASHSAHRSVTRAIRERDPDAAVRRMSRHVHAYAAAALEVENRTAIALGEDDGLQR